MDESCTSVYESRVTKTNLPVSPPRESRLPARPARFCLVLSAFQVVLGLAQNDSLLVAILLWAPVPWSSVTQFVHLYPGVPAFQETEITHAAKTSVFRSSGRFLSFFIAFFFF